MGLLSGHKPEEEPPTVADLAPSQDTEQMKIMRWRKLQLMRAGYGARNAALLAVSSHVDLHYACDLLRTCPENHAVQILL